MKIKTTKQLNLPQLIEWVIENKKFGCTYISDNFNKVYVTDDGIIEFNGSFYRDIFTIITFEEITEDTVFETLIEIYKNAENLMFYTVHGNVSINNVKTNEYLITSGFYILNDDLTMTLIWRDGKLVE